MGIPAPDPQPKVPVVCREEYTLFLEQATASNTFVHCDVKARWSPSVARRLKADWETLKGLHGGPIYALHPVGDRKHLKFLTQFGLRFVISYPDARGKPTELFST